MNYVGTASLKHPRITYNQMKRCVTNDCNETAFQIKSYIDKSIDPCENFYNFACGNYIKNIEIPEGRASVDLFTSAEDSVSEQLHKIINGPPNVNDTKPVQLAKNFYSSCLNESIIEELGVKPLIDMLNEVGGWPVVNGDDWMENEHFNWVNTIKRFRRIGFNTRAIFSLNLETDSKNSSRRILVVSFCHIFVSIQIFIRNKVLILQIDQTQHDLEREFLMRGMNDKSVKVYYNSMVGSAVVLKANKERAKREMKDALEFEMKLANV